MPHQIRYSARFKRQYKKLGRAGRPQLIGQLEAVITLLAEGKTLSARYKNHQLVGQLKEFFECHIAPDWLLLHRSWVEGDCRILELAAMGSHSELFG